MNDEIRELFGFDLGDGESCVAWLRRDVTGEPLLLEIAGRKNLLTALGEHEKLGVLIGEQAFLADADKLYLRFKSRFLTDPAAPRLIRMFAGCVLSEIRKTGKLEEDERCAFFIGCPSGWSAEQREKYRKLFESAGFPNARVIPESRAAFMFVRESGELRLPDDQLTRPTLIVDAGSSTVDFTFVNELRTQAAFDFGETRLGGGLVDELLLEKNLEGHPRAAVLRDIFEKCPQYRARCELEARRVKEMYFTRKKQLPSLTMPCESSVKVYYTHPPITVDISADERKMREILNKPLESLGGASFLGAFRASMERARDALAATPPETVLLTGGASRMGFVEELAREIFPAAAVLFGAEPEFSIGRGLCLALRVDLKTERFEGAVRELVESDAVENIVLDALPALFRQISPVIAGEIVESCAPVAFRRWKTGQLKTIGDMNQYLRRELGESLRGGELRGKLRQTTKKWMEDIRPDLEKLTDPICAQAELPLTSLRLPVEMDLGAEKLDFASDQVMDLKALQTAVDVVVASVVAMLLGGSGVAFLMAGPVGLVVSFVIGFVASRLGTTLARHHLDRFDMPAFMRALFTQNMFERKIENNKADIAADIERQLMNQLNPPTEAALSMVGEVSRAVEGQLMERAEQARLLIH